MPHHGILSRVSACCAVLCRGPAPCHAVPCYACPALLLIDILYDQDCPSSDKESADLALLLVPYAQDANVRLQVAEKQREELWQLRQQLQDLTRSEKAQQVEAARLQQELHEYQNRTQQQVQAQQEENDRLRQQMQDYDARAKQVLQEQQIVNDRLREQLTEYEARAKQVVQEQKDEANRLQQQLQDYETRAKQVVQEQKQENERLREEMAQYQGLAKEFVRQRHDMARMQEQLQGERQRAHDLEGASEVMRWVGTQRFGWQAAL